MVFWEMVAQGIIERAIEKSVEYVSEHREEIMEFVDEWAEKHAATEDDDAGWCLPRDFPMP